MAQSSSNEPHDMSKDPKRKAKSSDPGSWMKYGCWLDLNNKDLVQCSLCSKQMRVGVRKLKQHLVGGFGDVQMCPETTKAIIKEMQDCIRKSARRKTNVPLDDDVDDVEEVELNESSTAASNTVPSSGTSSKRKMTAFHFTIPQKKPTKSVAFMVRKTPEEVIEERHSRGPYQTTIESSTKTQEEKDRVCMHIANFYYECGIPFNAGKLKKGQFGPGLKPPTYHDLRVPLIEKAKKETKI